MIINITLPNLKDFIGEAKLAMESSESLIVSDSND
jgi:hypothetical protein